MDLVGMRRRLQTATSDPKFKRLFQFQRPPRSSPAHPPLISPLCRSFSSQNQAQLTKFEASRTISPALAFSPFALHSLLRLRPATIATLSTVTLRPAATNLRIGGILTRLWLQARSFRAMTESGASPPPSNSPEKNDVALDGSDSESMDTDSNVQATDTDSMALNGGSNGVAVVTSLREAARMGDKGMSVDESHRSEVVTPPRTPALTENPASKGLNETRTELLQRVQALKKDLENWRGKLDTQVKSYREELGDLRSSLNSEVDQLRVEFQDLRKTLQQQRELTSARFKKLDEPFETAVDSESTPAVEAEPLKAAIDLNPPLPATVEITN